MSRGVQNAQMQGPQTQHANGAQGTDTGACWWSTYAEGGDGKDGISRF